MAAETGVASRALLGEAEAHARSQLRRELDAGRNDHSFSTAWTFLWERMWTLTDFDRIEERPTEWLRESLPARWLLHHRPDAFSDYEPTTAEGALLSMSLDELSGLAASVGHAAAVRFPVKLWRYDLYEEYSQLAGFVGTAAASLAPPRGQTLVSGSWLSRSRPPWRYGSDAVAGLLLHESVHLYWTAVWPRTTSFVGSSLHAALEEAATTLVEHMARFRICQAPTEVFLASLEAAVTHGSYRKVTSALVDLLYRQPGRDPWSEPEWIWRVMECVCNIPEEDELIESLNELLHLDLEPSWLWRNRFPDPYSE